MDQKQMKDNERIIQNNAVLLIHDLTDWVFLDQYLLIKMLKNQKPSAVVFLNYWLGVYVPLFMPLM